MTAAKASIPGCVKASYHPTGSCIVTTSHAKEWQLYSTETCQILAQIATQSPVTAVQFHPDGLVLGVGLASGETLIYDIRTQELAITLAAP